MIRLLKVKRKNYFSTIIEMWKFTKVSFFLLHYFFKKIILSITFLFFFFYSNKKFLFDRSNHRDDLFRFEDIS